MTGFENPGTAGPRLTHSATALGSRCLTVAQLETLGLNSLPDLSLCHPPPPSPCEIPLGEKLLVGLEGIQVERQSPLLTALERSLRETWPDQSERPISPPCSVPSLPAPSALILPLDPPLTLHTHTHTHTHTPSEPTVQATPWCGHLPFFLLPMSGKPQDLLLPSAVTGTFPALLSHPTSDPPLGLCTSSLPQDPGCSQ